MVHWGIVTMVFQLATASPGSGFGKIAFQGDTFGAGFSGDAVYFVSHTKAGDEMTVLVSNTPHLCDAIKTKHAGSDLRIWVAEVADRGAGMLHVDTGHHIILTDDDLYDNSFGHEGGVAMLAYIHKRTGTGRAPAFVGMAARGHVNITAFDGRGGDVTGDYRATFQLGYNQGLGGYVQTAGTGEFHASHCPEGAKWQEALLGTS